MWANEEKVSFLDCTEALGGGNRISGLQSNFLWQGSALGRGIGGRDEDGRDPMVSKGAQLERKHVAEQGQALKRTGG